MLDWLFSDPLPAGADAPDFSLVSDQGATVRLADFKGRQNVVLVFYPKDNTSLCTKQLCEFRESWALAKGKNTAVFGVNPGSVESHTAFRAKFQLPYPLLVDPGQQVAKLFSAHGLIVKRTVYLIGKSGKIRFSRRGVPKPAEVLGAAE
ncbi:MAG: peroxiredoxin [Bryobacteraceae bacterium]|nr:peroxiredoxin [Bryobacteraceae bacterium]